MATFIITSNSSCCGVGAALLPENRFAVNSIAYICKKASQQGVLDPVAIKSTKAINNSYGQTVGVYVDSFNGIWNENELCDETTAQALALAYLHHQQELLLELSVQCR